MFPDLPGVWYGIKDGDLRARHMLNNHYSGIRYADGRKVKLCAGPGEKMLLMTSDSQALFIWRKFIDASGQQGVNCAVFQNNAPDKYLSSALIKEACDLAWQRWRGERLYTYVNSGKVRSINPGYCFKVAGWRQCGITKVNKLLIFEILPDNCIEVIRIGEWRRYYAAIENVRGIE